MTTWKLSIKPESQPGWDAFEKCREKSLLGVGWHHAYAKKHPANLEEAKRLVEEEWGNWPYQLRYLLEEVKAGDHVWLHRDGKYYLCQVTDDSILYGKEIDPDYEDYDLGHARKAKWVHVPDKFVTGKIQRGTIAQRTIQRIHITESEAKFNQILFDKLSKDEAWAPRIDEEALSKSLANIKPAEFFSCMSPDDVEDVVAAYLQSKGWMLIKSTCFRSKPKFEFSMLNQKAEIARVQVKSGEIPLAPENYKDDVDNRNRVFLFSTCENPYLGESVSNVHPIKHECIIKWLKGNWWAITLPLKSRLSMSLLGSEL